MQGLALTAPWYLQLPLMNKLHFLPSLIRPVLLVLAALQRLLPRQICCMVAADAHHVLLLALPLVVGATAGAAAGTTAVAASGAD